MKKEGFWRALTTLIILAIIVIGVSVYLIFNKAAIGPAFLVLGFMSLVILDAFKISIKSIYPDIIFGAIDNGVLVFVAVLGGMYAGVFGAVIGGAAGNTITDGLGGLFEGKMAERLRKQKIKEERSAMSTMLGKVIGCLFGAGIGLIIVWLIGIIF